MKPFFFRALGASLALAFVFAAGLPAAAAALPRHPSAPKLALDQNAPAFAEASVRAIAGTWDPREMRKRAAPEIMTPFVVRALPNVYAGLDAKLGRLETLSAPVADNGPPLPGRDPMANRTQGALPVPVPHDGMAQRYLFDAKFAKGGPARVEVVLRYRGKWQIVGLHIDSPLLEH